VETFAQFGVVFLLFALGLEFSLTKVLKKIYGYYIQYNTSLPKVFLTNIHIKWFPYCIRHFYQLKVVGPVAVLGGLLQIALFMFLCGLTAAVYAPINL
jgi:Kef-type K+ transport system membrane component KefB